MQSRVPHMLQQLLTGPSAGVGVPAVSIWLSVSHIIAEEFWPIFLYSVSVHWGLWACCCLLLTSLHVPLQHFEVWTLTGRLPHLDSFLFHYTHVDLLHLGSLSFCCMTQILPSFTLALGQTASHLILEESPVVAKQTQFIILPLPCLRVSMRCSCWYVVHYGQNIVTYKNYFFTWMYTLFFLFKLYLPTVLAFDLSPVNCWHVTKIHSLEIKETEVTSKPQKDKRLSKWYQRDRHIFFTLQFLTKHEGVSIWFCSIPP